MLSPQEVATLREAAKVVAGVWGKAELARRVEAIADKAEREGVASARKDR